MDFGPGRTLAAQSKVGHVVSTVELLFIYYAKT